MYADPMVTRYLGNGEPLDAHGSWRACAALAGDWVLRGYGQWIAEEKSTRTALGRVGIYNPAGWPGLEVGWALSPDHWGRGYATEGGAAAVRYAFDVVGADRVISLIQPDNLPSIRVAEKIGGRLEDTITVMGKQARVYAYTRQTLHG